MAVSFKTDASYGINLMKLFGVEQYLLDAAKAEGVIVDQKSPGSFAVRTSDGVLVSTVTVKGQAISLAKSGSLGPASKQSIKYEFEAALKKAIKNFQYQGSVPNYQPATNVTAVKLKSLVDELVGTSDISSSSSSAEVEDAIHKILKPAPKGPIPLADATALYQEVMGTSTMSVYRVVALVKGAVLAVRIKPSMLSFRVAGPSLKYYHARLKDLGFSVKDSYASAHYSVSDQSLRNKTLGAICGAIGFTNCISLGSLEDIK